MIAYKSDVVYPDVKNGKYRFVYEELFLKKKKKKKKRKENERKIYPRTKVMRFMEFKKTHLWILAEMIKWLIAPAFAYI